MKNPECTPMSPELESELLNAFPQYLSDGEETMSREFFPQFIFYQREDAKTRWCCCTGCREAFYAHKETAPDFFRKSHGEFAACPFCGQRAELKAMGRYSSFESLESHELVAQLSRHGEYLLMQAGQMRRVFYREGDGIECDLTFEPYIHYAFAPGVRAMWKKCHMSWFGHGLFTDDEWHLEKSVREPFPPGMYIGGGDFRPYWLLGLDQLAESSMRYCQFGSWFDHAYGSYLEPELYDAQPVKVLWLARYLAEYTRRPQMEMLVKLGHCDVVTDLIRRRNQNGLFVNWKAKDPAAFFRLSKQDYRAFQGSGLTLLRLKHYRELSKSGQVSSLSEYLELIRWMDVHFDTVCSTAKLAGVTLSKAVHYVSAQMTGRNRDRMVTMWKDYIEAAVKLGYDLSRNDVAMPENLVARHDAATAAVMSETDKKLERGYRRRRKQLEAQFGFEADGLRVIVPSGVRDIVAEGNILQHCVGGYAARHCQGKVTILFLRKTEAPYLPYVTIEMTVETNCRLLAVRQIHGFQNDRCALSPSILHEGFLARWLAWVHDGSPRDCDGKPVEADGMKKEVTAA